MSFENTFEGAVKGDLSVAEADWSLIFKPASRGCPDVDRVVASSEVNVNEVCTGKMHGVWAALADQTGPMILCKPITRPFVLRVMTFLGTWYRVNISGMVTPHRTSERNCITARRLAVLMREPEAQVAYALRLLAVDQAVWMTQVNGLTEFRFNKLFI